MSQYILAIYLYISGHNDRQLSARLNLQLKKTYIHTLFFYIYFCLVFINFFCSLYFYDRCQLQFDLQLNLVSQTRAPFRVLQLYIPTAAHSIYIQYSKNILRTKIVSRKIAYSYPKIKRPDLFSLKSTTVIYVGPSKKPSIQPNIIYVDPLHVNSFRLGATSSTVGYKII